VPDIYAPCHIAGGMTAYGFENDPKRIGFQCARYKVVAKLLEGKRHVLEVGCADGFGARIVRQHVALVDAVDRDPEAIWQAILNGSPRWPIAFQTHNILDGPRTGYDAAYCLDLFEHIPPIDEDKLLANLCACAPVCIIGTPSLESQAYASEISRAGHVNCVTKGGLRERMQRHWSQVFMLGMNDETLHVGHDGMTHYLFGIGVA